MLFRKRNLSFHEIVEKRSCLFWVSCWNDDKMVRSMLVSAWEVWVVSSGLTNGISHYIITSVEHNILSQGLANYGPQAKSHLHPAIVWPWPVRQDWFLHVKMVGKKKKRRFHNMWKLHKIQIPIKFYGNTANLIYFGIAYGCFYITTAELISCDRDHMASKI